MEYFYFTCLMAVLCIIIFAIATLIVMRNKRRNKRLLPAFKAVLITGCDKGFGFHLARRLDEEGYKVFAGCLDVEGQGPLTLAKDASPRLELVTLDVTKDAHIEAAKVHVMDSLAGYVLWAVVNNAGVACHAEFEWIPQGAWRHVLEVNLMGVASVTRAFLPLVRASRGRVVNMTSLAGRCAVPGFTAYSASKFGVIGFSDSLRREVACFGVKVITVEPAMYSTDLTSPANFLGQTEAFWDDAEPGVRRDYGEDYFQASMAKRRNLLKWASPDIQEVVDCSIHAVTSAEPRPRYATPPGLSLGQDVMTSLWTELQDYILAKVLGVGARPDMLNPKENGRMGRRRSTFGAR